MKHNKTNILSKEIRVKMKDLFILVIKMNLCVFKVALNQNIAHANGSLIAS